MASAASRVAGIGVFYYSHQNVQLQNKESGYPTKVHKVKEMYEKPGTQLLCL
jgi:hypothetical protein